MVNGGGLKKLSDGVGGCVLPELLSAYWAELYIHGCAMCIMMRVMRVLACTCANGLLFSIAGFHCFEKLLS